MSAQGAVPRFLDYRVRDGAEFAYKQAEAMVAEKRRREAEARIAEAKLSKQETDDA